MRKLFTLKRSFFFFFIILATLSLLMFGALQMILRAQHEIERAGDSRYESYKLANEVRSNSEHLTQAVRSYVVTGDARYEAIYWDIVAISSGKKARADGRTVSMTDLMKQAGFTDQEFAKLTEAQSLSTALIKTEEVAMHAVKGEYDDGSGKFSKKDTPDLEKARKLVHDDVYEKNAAAIMRPINEFEKLMDLRTTGELDKARRDGGIAYMVGLAMLCLTVVVSVTVLYALYVLIKKQLDQSLAVAERLATGDLTAELVVERDDELGRLMGAINGIGQGLAGVVGNVRTGTETINVASREIAVGNADLSNRTESQASSLEETASSMEELTSTVRQNADNARQANSLVTSASELAVKGGKVVGDVVHTMGSIKESSSKIVDIISVIDGIAFQTNILALNAAVEAARAGEQGRGFAVVASEVRSLAQRSASAAKEIKQLISDSVGKVEAGGKLVDEAGATMGEIVTSVKHVADIMGEITAASQEQSTGIEEVNRAITQMDEITQQNAALVEQAAAAAESLQEQADLLAQAVSVFKLSGSDHARVQPHAHPQPVRHVAPVTAAASPAARKFTPAAAATTPKAVPKLTQNKTAVSAAAPASSGKLKPALAGADDGNSWEEF
ncbi:MULTISPECIES: methyl-accepting chemotaxis protein [unclassified Herbaspirillum]|uniref:methyl-accepting chemotaxis protein n=1 Tax=unclassified Herbaspirillum TaxID=2624150 RepID=UPI000E2E5BB8|nr:MULTISPECIES: methyl-accepting chemotaxis protein [unclassified Herbaspirillum]RFB68107.1 HAMP domain-containing protein [Herbaspirillum sp. 3R-3a1]TFI06552.1 HAMP domain-containing protein [Herbaspirillum sp. 3R11]TFI13836.1 HAMP domain-containing protein [Herbaspirillum sp. 3R-11]TFI18515.1 HAMP domain-containing protein [Herbaspirillum sp. 3C11]